METTHGVTFAQWAREIFNEYLCKTPLFNFMGTSSHNIFQVKTEFGLNPGDSTPHQLRGLLKDTNDLVFFDQRVLVDSLRHGVILRGDMKVQQIAFNLRNQAREALVDWAAYRIEKDIINALTQTQVGRERGRYLYGCSDANWNMTHATALSNVDCTNDKLSPHLISRAKRKATLEGDRKMRPFSTKIGSNVEEMYVLFAHPLAIRDLQMDSSFMDANHYMPDSFKDNPIFTSQKYKGVWDGVVIYEMDMPLLPSVGLSNIQLAHNVLCGAQACNIVYGKYTSYKEDIDEFGNENGFAIDEIRGISKGVFNGIDHGIINVFTAALND